MSRMKFRDLALGVMVLFGTTACQDLFVPNLNDPDRFRANSDPQALEGLGAGAFLTYWGTQNATNVSALFPNMATEMTSTTNVGGFWGESQVPRGPHANPVTAPALSTTGAREHWAQLLRAVALSDDVLRLTDPNEPGSLKIIIGGEDLTARSRAFGHFVQGIAWGNMANVYDRAMVVLPDEEIPTNPADAILPADEALEAALESLDKAIAIAQQNPGIVFPGYASPGGGERWFRSPDDISAATFIQIANTVAARILTLHARTPADRAATDWNRVLSYTQNGLQNQDLEIVLHSNSGGTSSFLSILQNETLNAGTCTTCSRWDMLLIGHGDISGAYQTWVAAEPGAKDRFDIVSPDRRLQGPGGPTSLGAYTRHLTTNGAFVAARQSYYRSAYQWRRHAHRQGITGLGAGGGAPTAATVGLRGQNSGTAYVVTADENRLYAAEAHLRLGNAAQARDLINVTRTRPVVIPPATTTIPNLPAVTLQGAPHSAPGANDCVPRTDAGQCGDLMVALWYERMIELAGIEATRGWADNRGFGLMEDRSWLQLPIPGNELDQLRDTSNEMLIPLYSFGGDEPFSAVYAPVGGGWSGNP